MNCCTYRLKLPDKGGVHVYQMAVWLVKATWLNKKWRCCASKDYSGSGKGWWVVLYNHPIGSINRLYTRYILPFGGLYNPYISLPPITRTIIIPWPKAVLGYWFPVIYGPYILLHAIVQFTVMFMCTWMAFSSTKAWEKKKHNPWFKAAGEWNQSLDARTRRKIVRSSWNKQPWGVPSAREIQFDGGSILFTT